MFDKERNYLGVRRREGPGGDLWANQHRTHLNRQFLMMDLDGVMGVHRSPAGQKSDIERQYGLVAVFDRKGGRDSLDKGWVTSSWNCQVGICNLVASAQGIVPRFFYVLGEASPYLLLNQKLDARSCRAGPREKLEIDKLNWTEYWSSFGMNDIRNSLAEKILPEHEALKGAGIWADCPGIKKERNLILNQVDEQYNGFLHYCADQIFVEYTYSWGNVRIVSIFDRRMTPSTCHDTPITTYFYLWLCRVIGSQQKHAPRYFHVVGETPPWRLVERDIATGTPNYLGKLSTDSWLHNWVDFKLLELRQRLS